MVVHPDSEFLDDIAGKLREVCYSVVFLQTFHSDSFEVLINLLFYYLFFSVSIVLIKKILSYNPLFTLFHYSNLVK